MTKNIIICCDGTGNEIKENQSNVLKFFRVLEKTDKQIVFYDPGVGTIGDSGAWARLKNKAKGVFGLVTGYGLDDNLLSAYLFLLKNYKPDDSIYLFGFSRGAYTVRVLAGFINMVGLLKPEQENLCGYALTAYKQASEKDNFAIAWRVQEMLSTQRVTIKFMGCWDTVGSIIVPRPDRFYIPSLESLPYTQKNPCVQVFRHAMAIDECRRMFRLSPWREKQLFKSQPFLPDDKAIEQDIEQIWFAGVHSDIGGGYPENESGAAKIPLKWMVEEAEKFGLSFKKEMVKRLVLGKNPVNSKRIYARPNPKSDLHDSMSLGWQILEWLPKNIKWKNWAQRKSFFGYYIPRSEPRLILPGAKLDESVLQRIDKTKYNPVNILF